MRGPVQPAWRSPMFTGCVDEDEPAKERGRGGTKPGAVVSESRGRGGPVATDGARFTDRSRIDGLVGAELYCHGVFI